MASLEAYLAELRAELPLPPSEREEAIEEIAGHVADATASLVARGIAYEEAERRSLSRFGPPDALADDLARARRTPRHALVAAGTAVRVTVVTGLRTLIVGWAVLVVTAIAASIIGRLVGSWLGYEAPAVWPGRGGNAVLTGMLAALVAFAVGRALPDALAVAARRRASVLRPYILVAGAGLAAGIGWFGITAEYGPISVVLTALLPLWFGLGVLRPQLLPGWLAGRTGLAGAALIALMLLGLGLFAANVVTEPGEASPPIRADQGVAAAGFERIAPIYQPDVAIIDSWGSWVAGNVVTAEWHLGEGASLAGWSDLRVEVWLGIGDATYGPAVLDPRVNRPLSSTPVVTQDGVLSATVEVPAIPDATRYILALVGEAPDGRTRQLTWPDEVLVHWDGTVAEYLTTERPW